MKNLEFCWCRREEATGGMHLTGNARLVNFLAPGKVNKIEPTALRSFYFLAGNDSDSSGRGTALTVSNGFRNLPPQRNITVLPANMTTRKKQPESEKSPKAGNWWGGVVCMSQKWGQFAGFLGGVEV